MYDDSGLITQVIILKSLYELIFSFFKKKRLTVLFFNFFY